MLFARLQHRHLVRLLGFCLEGDERLLVYEFLPNVSLDRFIFGLVSLPLNYHILFCSNFFFLLGWKHFHIYLFIRIIHVHEFVDPINHAQLNWKKRYKIIGGIAQGLLYLHEDSQLRIIHWDLKASNILLDAYMNPKISDE